MPLVSFTTQEGLSQETGNHLFDMCLSKGALPKGVTRTRVCLSTMPGVLGEASRVTCTLHTERGSLGDGSEQRKCSVHCPGHWQGPQVCGEAGVHLKPGGCSGSSCLLEWKSSRVTDVSCGTASICIGWSELSVIITH